MSNIDVVSAGNRRIKALLQALSEGEDPNRRDSEGETPLVTVVSYANLLSVKAVLDYGADPNGRGDEGLTPLMVLVSREGSRDGVASDIVGSIHGRFGSVGNACQIAEVLLAHGADLNAIDNEGATALMYAGANGAITLLRLLLDRGANPNIQDHKGNTALIWGASFTTGIFGDNDNAPALSLLLEKEGLLTRDTVNQNGMTALLYAIANGLDAHVRVLLDHVDHGASLDVAPGAKPLFPITRSLLSGDLERLKAALRQHPDQVDEPLPEEASEEDEDDMEDEAAEPSRQTRTPLMWAAAWGRLDMVDVLIAAGADVNAVDSSHWTALLHAVFDGHTEIVQRLLKAGADASIVGAESQFYDYQNYPRNAIYWAVEKRRDDVIPILLEHGVSLSSKDGGPGMEKLASAGYLDLVKRLQAMGEPLYIWQAAEARDPSLVQSLLAANSNVDINAAAGATKMSPLHIAACSGNTDVIRLLVSRGADINSRTFFNETPLILATKYSQEEAARAFLEAGADRSLKDLNGKTALDYAEARQNQNLIRLLVE